MERKSAEQRLMEHILDKRSVLEESEKQKKIREGLEGYKKFAEDNPEIIEEWDRIWEELEQELEEEDYEDIWDDIEYAEEQEQEGKTNKHTITLSLEDNELDKEAFEVVVRMLGIAVEEALERVISEIASGEVIKEELTEEEIRRLLELEDDEEFEEDYYDEELGYEDDFEYDNDDIVEEEILENKETKREWVEITEDGKEVRVEEITTKTRSRKFLY